MAKKLLKDAGFRIIGSVEESGGNKTLRDEYGRILGYYDAASDATKDAYGKIVGFGDILAALLNIKL